MSSLKVIARYAGVNYSMQVDPLLKTLPYEGREGLAGACEAHGRLKSDKNPADAGISCFVTVYVYEDGQWASEVAVYNDSMFKPVGILKMDWAVIMNDKILHAEGGKILADQAGTAVRIGKLRYAPRLDYTPEFWLPQDIKYGMSFPTTHVDPTAGTHQTGSPRNEFWDDDVAMYVKTGETKWLDRLHEFALFQAERPYHLSDNDAELFDYQKKYSDKKSVEFFDGKIILPKHPLNGLNMNGGDLEHMTIDKLYHSYMALGSRLALRELMQCCNWMPLSYQFDQGDKKHPVSERVVGWVAKAWALGADATAGQKYFEMIEQLIRQTSNYAVVSPDAEITYMLGTTAPDYRHIPDQKFSCVWQAGIGIHGLATYLRMAEKYGKTAAPEYEQAKKLIFAAVNGIMKYGYKPPLGFCQDYGIEWVANEPDPQPTWTSTGQWVLAGLVDAIAINGALPDALKAEATEAFKAGFKYMAEKTPDHSTPPFVKWPDLYLRSLIRGDKIVIVSKAIPT
jgi:hypothetical protein